MKKVTVLRFLKVPKFFSYVIIFLGPLFFSWICVKIWLHIYPQVNVFTKEDNNILALMATLTGIGYIVFAQRAVETAWKKFDTIKLMCIDCDDNDFKQFKKANAIKIEGPMHIVIGILSFLMTFLLSVMSYDNLLIGKIAIGTWTYLISLLLIVANELDNPLSGVWSITTPETWMKKMTEVSK